MRLRSLACVSFIAAGLAACGGGGGGDDTGGDDTSGDPPTAYRADFVELRDPHLFAVGGAFDVTDTVNESIAENLITDDPVDGKLDLSLVLVFRPLDPSASSTRADAVLSAACPPPADTTTCSADADSTVVESNATNSGSGCLAPAGGTTGDYDPPITTPAGPCFVSDPELVELVASDVVLTLEEARIAGDYGAGRIENGLLIGFMTEETAANTTIPEDTPIVGGDMLDTLLLEEDKDTGPGGASGWWFHINFSGGEVPYTE
jgi:hypothetical protein